MSVSVTVSGDESTSVISSQLNTGSITVSGSESIQVTSAGVNSASVTVSTGDPVTISSNFSNFVTGSIVRPNEISSFITTSNLSALETATGDLNTRVNSNDSDISDLNTATGTLNVATGLLNDATGSLNTATGLLVPKSETGSFLTSAQINTNISTAVSNLVDSAPDTLNTLKELASGLGNDANFSTTVTTTLGNKVNKSETGSFAVTGSDVTFANLTVSGDILPDTNIARDIGSPSKRFRDLYLSGSSIFLGESKLSFTAGAEGGLSITGQGTTGRFLQDVETGSLLLPLETATGSLNTATGTLNTNVNTVSGLIISNDSDISNLNTATGLLTGATGILSTATGELNTATGLLTGATGVLSIATGELNTATGVLNTATGSLSAATGSLNTATGTLNTNIGTVSGLITSNNSGIADLNTATGLLTGATGALNTATGELNTATGTLNTNIGTVSGLITSNDSDISNLNTATGLLSGATGALSTATGLLQGVTGSFAQTGSGNFGSLNVTGTLQIGSTPAYSQTRSIKLHDNGVQFGARISLIGTTDNGFPGLEMLTDGSLSKRTLIRHEGEGSNDYGLGFYTTNGGSISESVRFDGNGSVGIGTSSPADELTIRGAQFNKTHVSIGDNADRLRLGYIHSSSLDTGSSAAQIGSSASRELKIAAASNDSSSIKFYTNAAAGSPTQRMVIDNSGDVGIGTTTPSAKLHVAGDTILSGVLTVTGNISSPSITSLNTATGLLVQKTETGNFASLNQDAVFQGSLESQEVNCEGGDGYVLEGKQFAQLAEFLKLGDHDGGNFATALFSNGGTEAIRITGGNVGIGTTTPNTKLFVDAGATNSVAKFVSSDDKAVIQIADNDTDVHLIAKDSKLSIGSGTSDFDKFNVNIANGDTTIAGITTVGKITLSENTFVTETGSFTLGATHKGATVLLQNSSSINITIPSGTSGDVTTFIAETHNPVSFITGVGMSGLNSFQGAIDIAGIYGQAQVIFKSPVYAFLGGNIV